MQLARIRLFVLTVRQEGWRAALAKVRAYVAVRLRNGFLSALPSGGEGAVQADHRYLHGMWRTLARQEAFHAGAPPALIRKRRKIALVADMNLPQCRKYRVEQAAALWQTRGVEVMAAHYTDVTRAMDELQTATHLMLYRLRSEPLTANLLYEARRLKLPVLYDLDDPLFSVSAYETYANMDRVEPALKSHFVAEAPLYAEAMNAADVLSFSTPALAEHARLFSPRPAFLRRNFADTETLAAGAAASVEVQGSGDGLFRIAFASGSRGHEADFAVIAGEIAGFLDADPRRRLMILGHFDTRQLPEELASRVERHEFADYATYLRQLARADCAVMPLNDDLFNHCKSAARVIDAGAVGLPCVVGAVSDMAAVVRDGETGLVAGPGGWRDALETLAAPGEAREMGRLARKDMEGRWAASVEPHIVAPELRSWVEG
jgi:glycosyltransferase involved in cell wall biosynthesis